MSLLDALERTVSALHEHDRDAALVEYLRLLAAEMDRSEEVERGAAAALRRAQRRHGSDHSCVETVAALRAQLSRRAALNRIGARYAAGLVELTATRRSGRDLPAVLPEPTPNSPGAALRSIRGGA